LHLSEGQGAKELTGVYRWMVKIVVSAKHALWAPGVNGHSSSSAWWSPPPAARIQEDIQEHEKAWTSVIFIMWFRLGTSIITLLN